MHLFHFWWLEWIDLSNRTRFSYWLGFRMIFFWRLIIKKLIWNIKNKLQKQSLKMKLWVLLVIAIDCIKYIFLSKYRNNNSVDVMFIIVEFFSNLFTICQYYLYEKSYRIRILLYHKKFYVHTFKLFFWI